MDEDHSAADFLPDELTLPSLREASKACRGCSLFRNATQTVFGEGSPGARLMLVGEQPGDREDRQGRPFVGPAGQLLQQALDEAGIERDDVYVTNAVKHFKWEPRGTRRLHKKPLDSEIAACRPWLEAELALVRPTVLVCLGVTAAKSVFAKPVVLKNYRGSFHETRWSPATLVTAHPSSILRLPDKELTDAEFARLVDDLRLACTRLQESPGG